jgi:hypothetical protein
LFIYSVDCCFCFVVKEKRLKRNFKFWMWRRLERNIRLCCLFFCWIFCVKRRSFWLRVLWFDFNSFFACCVWVCCVFRDFFDFRRFFEWELIVVCVVFFVEKRRIENKKKLVLFRALLFASSSIRLLKACSFLFSLFSNEAF